VSGYLQYVLKECRDGEHVLGPSKITDQLIKAIGDWMTSILDIVWVYVSLHSMTPTLLDTSETKS